MKIENLRKISSQNLSGISATLIWEDRERSSEEIFISTQKSFSNDLRLGVEPFLLAASIPAMFYGEKRISIDSEVCPDLKQGLAEAISWLQYWLGKSKDFQIEVPVYASIQPSQVKPRTGSFFTGGIDSWANLKFSQINYPATHAGAIKDCLSVYGLQNYSHHHFENTFKEFETLSKDLEITFIPIYTNIYAHLLDLDQDYLFWKKAFNGAALASVGHAFSNRFTRLSIGSGNDIPNLTPHGTHPLLDTNYSCHSLRVRHEGVALSRIDKTKLLVDWPLALNNLKVCDEDIIPEGYLNCGKCEKCLMTMTTLVALGAAKTSKTFPFEVSEKSIKQNGYITHDGNKKILESLRPLLVERGRKDLVSGLDYLINRYSERNLRGTIKRFDRSFLGGRINSALKRNLAIENRINLEAYLIPD